MKGLLRFFINKKTIVLLGVIAGIAVIVGGYYYRTQILTGPVEVLIAKDTIKGETQIDVNMFIRIKMNSADLKALTKAAGGSESMIYKASEANSLIGKYVKISATIPKNGLFYKDIIVSEEEMPNYIWHEIEDDQTIFKMDVTALDADYNSIKPGQNVAIYSKYVDAVGTLIQECYIGSAKVYSVRDKSLNDISDKKYSGAAETMYFVVSNHYYQYLTLGPDMGVTFYPVPIGNMKEGTTCDGRLTDEFIKSKIYSSTIE